MTVCPRQHKRDIIAQTSRLRVVRCHTQRFSQELSPGLLVTSENVSRHQVLVTGCATVDPRAGFSDVQATVEARSGKRVVWNPGTDLDAHVAQEVRALLQEPLTADGAVQVALLNNRDLQALYAELGVAQADLVQAGLLKNPVFDGAARFP